MAVEKRFVAPKPYVQGGILGPVAAAIRGFSAEWARLRELMEQAA